jgi:hypothetical protein
LHKLAALGRDFGSPSLPVQSHGLLLWEDPGNIFEPNVIIFNWPKESHFLLPLENQSSVIWLQGILDQL